MNWSSYKESISKLTKKQKGDSFEHLTKIYLLNNPKYKILLKNVWMLDEVPMKIHKHLNLPKRDEGIDIICETHEHEFWSVQAKYRTDESTSISHHDLETFGSLSFGHCKNIKYALVSTSASKYAKLFSTYPDLGFITGDTWIKLDSEYFDLYQGSQSTLQFDPYDPYPHQEVAINKCLKHFKNKKESRGKLIMACGTGKSHTAYWISQSINAKKIIVAVPSISLVGQIMNDWIREIVANKQNYDFHIICSDKTTSKIDNDELNTNIQDLEIPVKTNIEEIADWLISRKHKKIIIFSTYQSGETLAKASDKAKFKFDFGIFDEAHKTVGGGKRKLSSHLLFDENIIISQRMFMTATERFYKGSSDEILSMDKKNIYGDTIHSLTFRKAIEISKKLARPILTDYEILPITISNQEISSIIKANCYVKPNKGKWDEQVQSRFLVALVALNKAIKKYNITHTITFHSSLAKAKAFQQSQEKFTDIFQDYNQSDSYYIEGKLKASERNKILSEFTNSKQAIISNARCLTEGVDVPKIDCVVFVDPKTSRIDIVQALGRALRYYKGKKKGYVLLPIMLNNEDESRDEIEYENILMTLRQLASNDGRIKEYFKAKKLGKPLPKTYPFRIDKELVAKNIDVEKFEKTLELKAYESTARLSWMPFEEAKAKARSLGIKSDSDFRKAVEKKLLPPDFPSPGRLHSVYPEYTTLGDFLGTGRVADRKKRFVLYDYKTAKKVIQKDYPHIRTVESYYKALEDGDIPKDKFPSSIYTFYKNFSSGDFFGTGIIAASKKGDQFYDFKTARLEARKLARKYSIKRQKDWIELSKKGLRPRQIPSRPDQTYKAEWASSSWPDFLGLDSLSVRQKAPFDLTRDFILSKGITSKAEWDRYNKKNKLPFGIPKSIDAVYVKEWSGSDAFFTNNYVNFNKFLRWSASKNIESESDWVSLREKQLIPDYIPKYPAIYYESEWVDEKSFYNKVQSIINE